VRFTDLKIQTFDQKQNPDFNVLMSDSVLNLETRVIETGRRSTIKRADFEIAGDSMQFNTVTHEGTMRGNVHMTIFNQKEIAGSTPKKK
jgi:lipopolysaccharide export system protein LptC